MMTMATALAMRKGQTPLKIVLNGISFATPLITKTFNPTGGVIRPISKTITINTPNHIGSKPNDSMTGKMIGIVSMIMAIPSNTHPSRIWQ